MIIATVVRVDTGKPFIERAELIVNADTSVSFKLPNGKFAGQEPWLDGPNQPNNYGVRYPDTEECGAYQKASTNGDAVVFHTRPQDVPCGYLLFIGKTF